MIKIDEENQVVQYDNEPEEPRSLFPNTRDFGVGDVLIDGTSIVDENGDADIPVMAQGRFGVAKIGANQGIRIDSDGLLRISGATIDMIKSGVNYDRPINTAGTVAAAFYGMAKAAGDTTQSQSDNAVGNYTDEAKQKILAMLGAESEEYELIADITTNTTLSEIEISKDTAQNSFKLKKMIVVGNIKQSTTGNADTYNTSYKVRINGESGDDYISSPAIKYATGTSELFFKCEAKVNKNAPIRIETVFANGKSTSANITSMAKDNIVNYITAFRIGRGSSTQSNIPVGSTFKIYGIRYPE